MKGFEQKNLYIIKKYIENCKFAGALTKENQLKGDESNTLIHSKDNAKILLILG